MLTMPPSDPGGLTPDEYASVVAFFLQRTGYPAGAQELPADLPQLMQMPVVPVR